MAEEEIKLKTYKVLRQLGWQGSTYALGDTVEMEPRFAEYYLEAKVLEEAKPTTTKTTTKSEQPQ